MITDNNQIFDVLLDKIEDIKVQRVTIGLNWTMVETEFGCGFAHTPARSTTGCFSIKYSGTLTKSSLKEMAHLVNLKNPHDVSIGLAAINAYYNRYDLKLKSSNGFDEFIDVEGPITIIGRFPGLSKRFKKVNIIEKDPHNNEFSEQEAAKLLPKSGSVIITSSTLLNGTAANLIQLAKNCRTCLIGPSTPLAPGLLDLGITILAGTLVRNTERVNAIISQAGYVKNFKPYIDFKILAN